MECLRPMGDPIVPEVTSPPEARCTGRDSPAPYMVTSHGKRACPSDSDTSDLPSSNTELEDENVQEEVNSEGSVEEEGDIVKQ